MKKSKFIEELVRLKDYTEDYSEDYDNYVECGRKLKKNKAKSSRNWSNVLYCLSVFSRFYVFFSLLVWLFGNAGHKSLFLPFGYKTIVLTIILSGFFMFFSRVEKKKFFKRIEKYNILTYKRNETYNFLREKYDNFQNPIVSFKFSSPNMLNAIIEKTEELYNEDDENVNLQNILNKVERENV